MSNDISTMYTKQRNNKEGRKGYGSWKFEKENSIAPNKYGMYLLTHKHKSNKQKRK